MDDDTPVAEEGFGARQGAEVEIEIARLIWSVSNTAESSGGMRENDREGAALNGVLTIL